MPFCPECRDEFQAWVKTCPDCHVALVAELRPESDPTSRPDRTRRASKSAKAKEPLALVASASNEPEAKMWAGILEDQGIHCMVKTHLSEMFRGFPPTANIIQPSNLQFDVCVLQSDVERAREILGSP
jgi:hypothetical protein